VPRRSKDKAKEPRRAFSREKAALYVFDKMVKKGRMPSPRPYGGNDVWVNVSLDDAIDDDERAARRRDANRRKGGRRTVSPSAAITVAVARRLQIDEAGAAAMIAPLFTAHLLSLISTEKRGKALLSLMVDYLASAETRPRYDAVFPMTTKLSDDEWKVMAPDVKRVMNVLSAIELGAEPQAIEALTALVVPSRWRDMLQFLVERANATTLENIEHGAPIAIMISFFKKVANRVLVASAENQPWPSKP
jgi:hypothetical protein